MNDSEWRALHGAAQLRLIAPEADADDAGTWEREGKAGKPDLTSVDALDLQKDLGAYYTDDRVARFLLRWAVVTGQEKVLDPGFGGGVFLEAAASRLSALGGDSSRQVFGVEIDDAAFCAASSKHLNREFAARLLRSSFFDVGVHDLPEIDAVVGNPPYIRYHRFQGEARKTALRRAQEAGVTISRLTSSWAPFLVHSIRFVREGGRLAMVVPAELLHAGYARPILAHLAASFRKVRIVTFSRRMFPDLSEDTILLLAAGKGQRAQDFRLVSLPDASLLATYENPEADLPIGTEIGGFALQPSRGRASEYLLAEPVRGLYRQLQRLSYVHALEDIADVGIGYVSGDNQFFHVNKETVSRYGLPFGMLRRVVRRGADLRGLRFTKADWQARFDSGDSVFLLYLPDRESLEDPVKAYLAEGVRLRVPERYKCRVRHPWYRIPHVYQGDALLTYMCGTAPRFVINEADVVAPNTLLVIRLHPLRGRPDVGARELALAWRTSLAELSSEIEGHSLGGGMLKLEPSEAGRVIAPLPRLCQAVAEGLVAEVDFLLRDGQFTVARERCDSVLLRDGLGMSARDIDLLREGLASLRSRRLNR